MDDPPGPVGASFRVFRGGGRDCEPRLARSANRDRWNAPAFRDFSLGFRLARIQSGR